MSIFGELDAEKIPTNPFWVEEGEYRAQITKAEISQNKDGTKTNLIIAFTILNADSEFEGKEVRQYLQIYPELTKESYKLLPVEERKIINRNMTNLKKLLCGQPEMERKGLGVDPAELDSDEWDPKTLVNLEVNIAVQNSGEEGQYTNLKWANLADSEEPPF